jgi:mono/diheme cytochrome c family protein
MMSPSMNVRRALLLLGTAALLSACGKQDNSAAAMQAAAALGPQSTAADPLARGRYLVKAADCAACHTTSDGAPFAGGVKLASPFGTFYGTNITPDKDHGIGNWSADDLYKALHDGVTPNKQLYPAMPYTSYRQLSRADSDAIYAYLMAQKPAAVANHEPELSFPFNMRFGVRFWNWVFLKDTLPDASTGPATRRPGHHAAWFGGAWLDGCGPADVLRHRYRAARFGLRRDVSGRASEQPVHDA